MDYKIEGQLWEYAIKRLPLGISALTLNLCTPLTVLHTFAVNINSPSLNQTPHYNKGSLIGVFTLQEQPELCNGGTQKAAQVSCNQH